ncbi:MAG: flotillin family protein [Oxalobacteraceae bacterium]
MSGSDFGSFILGLIVVAIVVAIGVWLLHWLYLRSSKERAFVRTGLGGQKVVLNGGAFVLPIVHDVIPVNMNTLRLEVSRGRDKALITFDRMRVDVIAEFYVRVQASSTAIANAAQTLGQRTMQPELLKELLEGKFVDALRTVAAEMSMEALHEKRGEFIKRVRAVVSEDLMQNGLELESASLTQLDQTGMEFFNPSNAFDAEGLTRLTETIEKRKKLRNDIEQDTLIQIRNKNLETEKLALEIDLEAEEAKLAQERTLEIARIEQATALTQDRASKKQQADRAEITARETVEKARIVSEKLIEEERIKKELEIQSAEIERRKQIELAEQQRAIDTAEQSKAEFEARAAADKARALAVAEEERVFTARETEMANRKKVIELIAAAQEAEREAIRLTIAATAEKNAAADRGAAIRAEAEAAADAERIRVAVTELRTQVEAEGLRLMNEAHNMLTQEARISALRMRLVEKLDSIVRESVKPMERIESIKILHVDGLAGGGSGGGGSGDGGGSGSNFTDSVVNSALRYRAQAPLVDQMLSEIGVKTGDIGKLAGAFSAITAAEGAEPAELTHKKDKAK